MEIVPSADIVRTLSPEARSKIYVHLVNYKVNRDQVDAMRFCGKSLDESFEGSDVSPETVDLVRPFVYRHGA